MKIYPNLATFAPLDEQEFEQGLRWRRKEAGDGLETEHILALCHRILTTASSLLIQLNYTIAAPSPDSAPAASSAPAPVPAHFLMLLFSDSAIFSLLISFFPGLRKKCRKGVYK